MQREDVDRLDLVLERIVKLLGHGHPGERPADLGLHVGVFQRAGPEGLAVRADRVEAAFGDLSLLLGDNG